MNISLTTYGTWDYMMMLSEHVHKMTRLPSIIKLIGAQATSILGQQGWLYLLK